MVARLFPILFPIRTFRPFLKVFFISLFLGFLVASGAHAQLSLGGTYAYTVTVTAGTNWNAVTISAPIPPEFTYINCGGGPGTCADVAGTVFWYIGNLIAGQSVTVGYNFIVTSCQSNVGSLVSTARVGSPVTTLVSPPIPFTINCPTDTPTFTLTPTITFTPSPTPTPTNSFTPSFTPTITYTPTLTYTPTITYTPTETYTPTITYTPTNSFTPTPTPVPLRVWPNPFNPRYAWNHELIAYQAPLDATMSIYTISGELTAGPFSPDGTGHIYWMEGLNNRGKRVSTGTYIYVVQQGSSPLLTGKLLLMMDP